MNKRIRKKKIWMIAAIVIAVMLLVAAFFYTPALPEAAEIAKQMKDVDGDLYFYGDSGGLYHISRRKGR